MKNISQSVILSAVLSVVSVHAGLLPSDPGVSVVPPGSTPGSGSLLPGAGGGGNTLPGGTPGAFYNGTLLPPSASIRGGGDFFEAPTTLNGSAVTDRGNNSKATRQVGEPQHSGYAGDPGGKSLWWKWQARSEGILTVSTAGSNFDTTLGVYTGESVSSLNRLTNDDNGGPGQTSLVSVRVAPGFIYYIAVDGYNGASGSVNLSLNFSPLVLSNDGTHDNDNFANRRRLAGTYVLDYAANYVATEEAGEFTFGNSVWWTWTAPVTGTVAISTLGSDFDTVLRVFTGTSVPALSVVAVNDDAGLRVRHSFLELDVIAGRVYQISVDGYPYTNGFEDWLANGVINLSFVLSPYRFAPSNDTFDFRIGIQGDSYEITDASNQISTLFPTVPLFEASEPAHGGSSSTDSVWWTWTATKDGLLELNASANAQSLIRPVIAVYTGSSVSNLTAVASARDVDVNGRTTLTTAVRKGQIYQIAVAGGAAGNTGTFTFSQSFTTGAPRITSHPGDITVQAGKKAVFNVSVSARTYNPTFRWQRRVGNGWVDLSDSATYAGTRTKQFAILNTPQNLNGNEFRCVVSNRFGRAASRPAQLTVTQPPTRGLLR